MNYISLRTSVFLGGGPHVKKCFRVFWTPSFWPATLQVDREAFDALTACIAEGDFDMCELVPAGDEDGVLVNPLGGNTVDMAGAAR